MVADTHASLAPHTYIHTYIGVFSMAHMNSTESLCAGKNSCVELPFGGLRVNSEGSSVARWKAQCRLPISDNRNFSLALTADALLSEIYLNRRFLKGWVTLSANFRWMGTSPTIHLWTVR